MVTESDTLFYRTDRVLPEYLSPVVCSLGCTSARETHECWIEICEGLEKILAERTVLAFHPEL